MKSLVCLLAVAPILSSANASVLDDMIKSFEIFGHNQRLVWRSFLAETYHNPEHQIPETCMKENFVGNSLNLIATSVRILENLFEDKLIDDVKDAFDQLWMQHVEECDFETNVNDLEAHCETAKCDPTTIVFRINFRHYDIMELLEELYDERGQDDASYEHIGQVFGKVFNIIINNEEKSTPSVIKSFL